MTSYMRKYVGADHFPRHLSDFDLERFFRLLPDDIQAIGTRFRADRRVGPAVQLVFLRASGRPLDRVSSIPTVLLRSLGESLGVRVPTIASLKAIYKRPETLNDHQIWARERLGLTLLGKDALDDVTSYLRVCAASAVNVDELVKFANQYLFDKKVLIPAERTVRDLARSAFSDIEAHAIEVVTKSIPRQTLEACRRAVFMRRDGQGGSTTLEWLKAPPRRHSPTALTDTLDKIKYLRGLGTHEWAIEAISLERQRAYARALAGRPASETKKRIDTTQTLEIVCFLRVALLDLTDTIIYQMGRRVADLVRGAYDKTHARQAKSSGKYRECLVSIRELVGDASVPAEQRLALIGQMIDAVNPTAPNSHAASVRETLIEETARIRPLLSALQGLDFKAQPTNGCLKNFQSLGEMYAGRETELPATHAAAVEKTWRELVDGPDRTRALKALEASTLLGLRKNLRRGSIWIDHSYSYRERDQLLIPKADWSDVREQHYSQLSLPTDPDQFLQTLLANIEVGLDAVAQAHRDGRLTIDAQGLLHLGALEALPTEVDPKRTRDLLFKQIGDVQFPDLLLEIDAQTLFSQVLLARRARSERELIALYAALIAHGTEIDARGVAAMIPQLDPTQVAVAMRALEAPGRLRKANERIVDFLVKHPIAELWGDGKSASSDMMSLDTSKHLWFARVDPRRRTYGTGIYTHLLNRNGIIYDQPIVHNERQHGVAIDGVVRYNDSTERVRLSLLAVDTHGYTNPAMAIAKLLGFDLCPQLRNLSERKLFLPYGFQVPDELADVVVREVSLRAIRKAWDELVRSAASIRSGRVSANVLLQRLFGRASSGDPLYRGADQLGRLLRTWFLCDFFSNPEFRREIHTILNRGESVHQLQRAVYSGKVAPERGRRRDEMIAISGSHALLTNAVLAWNTHQMQITVDRWRRSNQPIQDAWLARMGPAHFSHINFRGTFKFGVSKYADSLLDRSAGVAKTA
jgi:TnpA family transposase